MPLRRGVARLSLALLLAALAVPTAAGTDPLAAAEPGLESITAANLRAHLGLLASESMQGRETASPQLEIAADYAASVFALAGVEPAGDMAGGSRSYFQQFEVAEVTPRSQSLVLETREGETVTRRTYEPKADFTISGTASVERTAPLVFVGYGYHAREAGWNDYAGLDLKGKIAVALDGAPGRGNDASWFWKAENRRRYFGRAASIYKAMGAAEAGAVALVVVPAPNSDAPPLARELAENRPPRDDFSARNVRNLPPRREMVLANDDGAGAIHGGFGGVTTVRVSERVARQLLEGTGETPESLQTKIDQSMRPHGVALGNRRLTIDVRVDSRVLTTRNVLGMVRGSDPALANEAVVVGAHYDHEGARGGYVWAGADDNGSGTAGVLEIARAFARNPARPKRTVIFALWSGEEKGLLGSKHFVDRPTFPVEKIAAYVNLDMIGRDGDPASGGDPHAAVGAPAMAKPDPSAARVDPANWMSVEGSIDYPSLQATTEAMNARVGLALTYKPSEVRFAASDHLYFARRGVPVISYFDGGHADYHQPTDTAEKLNYPKMEKVSRLVYLTMWQLASAAERPARAVRPAGAPARAQSAAGAPAGQAAPAAALALPQERRLRNVRQLTFGGENAEAYFSFDEKWLAFQSTRDGYDCDRIYVMRADGSGERMVSTGTGRTTCAYFLPGDTKVLYASTHLGGRDCPPKPDFSRGYVWALYDAYDIFVTDLKTGALERLTSTPGYDAEATVSPDGTRVVFTSVRDGDLDIYTMKTDGSDVRRLTTEVGYDGGAFFSPDGRQIVYRAHHPEAPEATARYKELLARGLIEPRTLEIWVMNADGTGKRRVTSNGAANFAPYFHPDGKRIVFSSNLGDPKGRNFDLYLINADGTGLERITHNETFDGFPMFTRDGKRLVFASNRNAAKQGDTNVFIADWVD